MSPKTITINKNEDTDESAAQKENKQAQEEREEKSKIEIKNADSAGTKKDKNLQDQIEEHADQIVNAINYDRLKIWKEVLFHPTATLASEVKNNSLKRGAKDVFISSLPFLIIGVMALILAFLLIGSVAAAITSMLFIATSDKTWLGVFLGGILAAIAGLVLYLLLPIISWLITAGIQHLIAKALGGKSDFKTYAYLVALSISSTNAARIPLFIFSMIPLVNIIAQPILALVNFYGLYLNYKAVRTAHNLEKGKAIIVALLPYLIYVLLAIALFVAYFSAWFAVIFGSALTKG